MVAEPRSAVVVSLARVNLVGAYYCWLGRGVQVVVSMSKCCPVLHKDGRPSETTQGLGLWSNMVMFV